MKKFLDENFLLHNKTSQQLYHEYAAEMPIIDYHNHLPPDQVANDCNFENLSQAWLQGDHYKWRAMRSNGVQEHFITGTASDFDKFSQWAKTVPYTVRNPLYHWTHLELQRYFNIYELLHADNAKAIYEECSAKLRTKEYGVRNLLKRMKVEMICTTDDPIDSLAHHHTMQQEQSAIMMKPAFRPDKAMTVDNPALFNEYLARLEQVSNIDISSFNDYLDALKSRHDYFAAHQCNVSDHGLETMYAEDYSLTEVTQLFTKVRQGGLLSADECIRFKSAMLVIFAEWDFEKGWVQQYHLGALRNNNSRMMHSLGADTGWDSIGDFPQGRSLAKFLNRLDSQNKLTRTILYNLNPSDNAMMATMIGNFNDGSVAGKIQWGSAWWFLDQQDGMIRQLNTLSNMGLISRFVGMLTDSRSFLSFPRHEYFRRIICNLFGEEIERGELPADIKWTGKLIKDICYYNAREYFNLKDQSTNGGQLAI